MSVPFERLFPLNFTPSKSARARHHKINCHHLFLKRCRPVAPSNSAGSPKRGLEHGGRWVSLGCQKRSRTPRSLFFLHSFMFKKNLGCFFCVKNNPYIHVRKLQTEEVRCDLFFFSLHNRHLFLLTIFSAQRKFQTCSRSIIQLRNIPNVRNAIFQIF